MKHVALALLVACSGGGKSTRETVPPPDKVEAGKPIETATNLLSPEPAPPKGNPKTDLIPRSVLFGNPERAAVRMSPDGKWLSWIAPVNGVLNIWVAPVGKLDQAKSITHDTARPIYNYNWTFNTKYIVYAQDTAGDENFHLFRVDITDGKATDLTPSKGARAELAALSHKQPNKILISINDRNPQMMDLKSIDLVTGKQEMVAQNDDGFLGITTDHDLKPRLAPKKLPDGSTQIMQAVTKDGKLTWEAWEQIAFEDADTSGPAMFTPDNKSLYFTETRGRDTGAIVQMDLKTKKSKMIVEDAKSDAGGFLVHPTKKTLQAVSFEYDKVTWKVLDKSIQKDIDNLAKIEAGAHVDIVSRTTDDKTWVVVTRSETQPARYHVWDRAKQKAAFLFAAMPELEKQPLVKMKPVEIKSRDGLTLVSYLSLPNGGEGKTLPMVLYVHGGPWARDSWGFDPFAQLMANRGYAVLSVNYRGSTGFGKKFMNAANLQWSKKMHDDLLDAVQWAIDQKVTNKDSVCIFGGSYGGYATLVGITMTPDVFRCGVDIVGPSNLLTFMASIPAYWAPAIALLHQRVGNPDNAEGKALLVAASPLTHVAKIKKPLLIAQGKNDPRVKEAESEQIVKAMQKAGLPVTYALFPDEGHGFARPENNIAFTAITEAFLSAHLGGFYQPMTAEELKASSIQFKAGKSGIPGLPQ